MKILISRITGRLIATFQPEKTETAYQNVVAIILPSGSVVQLYSATRHDDVLIEIESRIIEN